MPRLKFSEVLSFSSEDPNHPAENLLNSQTFRKWKIAASEVGKQASVTLHLEKLSTVRSVDIGNDGCAFVEVLVARDEGNFEVLLAASSFMSPVEARNQTEISRVRMFGPDKLSKAALEQKWSRVKLVCTQPFNKQVQFGLSFISLNAPDAPVSKVEESNHSSGSNLLLGVGLKVQDEDNDSGINVGSLFARRKEAPSPLLTGAAAIRAASAAAISTAAQDPLSASASPASSKRKNPDDSQGFYQLNKKLNTSADSGRAASPSSSSKNNNYRTKNSSKDSSNNINGAKDNITQKTKATTPSTLSNNSTKENNNNPKKNQARAKQANEKNNTKSDPSTSALDHAVENGRPNSNRRVVDMTRPSVSSRSSTTPQQPRQYAPFSSLMHGVVYALSGYQNPQRSNLRDRMTAMGAKYKAAWDRSCNHLICAFANTPKYHEVLGKGKIVSHRWTDDCYTFKKKMPWKKYRLDPNGSSDDSEEEVWSEELRPKTCVAKTETATGASATFLVDTGRGGGARESAVASGCDPDVQPGPAEAATVPPHVGAGAPMSPSDDEAAYGGQTDGSEDEENTDDEIKRALAKNGNVSAAAAANSERPRGQNESSDTYDDDTDVDEAPPRLGRKDTSSLPLPSLLSCFTGKVFFLYGGPKREDCIRRYIVAFDGTISEYMDKSVHFVVTENDWDSTFDEALLSHPRLRFVRPAWVWSCSDAGKAVPYKQHEVNPH